MEPQNTIARIVLCTCPDEAAAGHLARGLVEARLAACANIIPGVRSVYRWEGSVQEEGEVLLVIKTSVDRYPALENWLQEHHPYEVPEIISLPVDKGFHPYLTWITHETS